MGSTSQTTDSNITNIQNQNTYNEFHHDEEHVKNYDIKSETVNNHKGADIEGGMRDLSGSLNTGNQCFGPSCPSLMNL